MARVTIEDCTKVIPNRFELVVLATNRARKIAAGSPLTVPRDNDKNAVVALREIAEETISVDNLREDAIKKMQLNIFKEPFQADQDFSPEDVPEILMDATTQEDYEDTGETEFEEEEVEEEDLIEPAHPLESENLEK